MKGNEKIIEHLNARLAEELTAINRYMVHAEMCDNWKYKRLDETIQKRAIAEMKHAEKLIARGAAITATSQIFAAILCAEETEALLLFRYTSNSLRRGNKSWN